MERAAILIGVRETGNLDRLPAAQSAARAMAAWANTQKIPPSRIIPVLDDTSPVTIARIRTAIDDLAATFVVEQLLIYFCGHGIYTRDSEIWLLSNSHRFREEAVNLAASVDAARQGVFPHVIFISDACRTAAVGIKDQRITGASIFEDQETTRTAEQDVDQFFACALNTTSNQTLANPQAHFQSIFTNTLISALKGSFEQVICAGAGDDHTGIHRIHPWQLKPLLKIEVPQAIRKAGLPQSAYQNPDARICSPPTSWIADLALLPKSRDLPRANGDEDDSVGHRQLFPPGDQLSSFIESASRESGISGFIGNIFQTIFSALPAPPPQPESTPADTLLSLTLDHTYWEPFKQVERLQNDLSPVDVVVKNQATRLILSDRPTESHFESGMGFRIHNFSLVEALPLSPAIHHIDQSPDAAIVWSQSPSVNVFLVFSDGRGTILPAIAGFITSLTFDRSEGESDLISVSYEPMDPNFRTDSHFDPLAFYKWQEMKALAETARENRALIASLTRSGLFRLDTGTMESAANAERLGRRLQSTKTYDPSMAIYAAYAYYDIQRTDLIQYMANFFVQERKLLLFDLALLTRTLMQEKGVPPPIPVFPFFPMLSRGWSLMASTPIRPPQGLEDLERHVTDSLWTLFDPEGVALIRANIATLENHYEGISFRPREIAARTQAR